MTPWLIVPALVAVTAAVLALMYLQLGKDPGQHAAPRPAPLRDMAARDGIHRVRVIPRKQTAGQPPAELTDTPCAEPPPAPNLAGDAATTAHAATEAART